MEGGTERRCRRSSAEGFVVVFELWKLKCVKKCVKIQRLPGSRWDFVLDYMGKVWPGRV